jgi:excisionase family DNA binding protein
MERLFTYFEAAQFVGVSVRTLQRLAHEGRVPRLNLIGTRLVRFREGDLERLVAESRVFEGPLGA